MKSMFLIGLTALSLAGSVYAGCGSCSKDKKSCTACDKKDGEGKCEKHAAKDKDAKTTEKK